jgi:hypothetical protein
MRSICRATPLNDIDSEMVFARATYQIGPRRPFESPALSARLIWPFVCRGDGGGEHRGSARAAGEAGDVCGASAPCFCTAGNCEDSREGGCFFIILFCRSLIISTHFSDGERTH